MLLTAIRRNGTESFPLLLVQGHFLPSFHQWPWSATFQTLPVLTVSTRMRLLSKHPILLRERRRLSAHLVTGELSVTSPCAKLFKWHKISSAKNGKGSKTRQGNLDQFVSTHGLFTLHRRMVVIVDPFFSSDVVEASSLQPVHAPYQAGPSSIFAAILGNLGRAVLEQATIKDLEDVGKVNIKI
jgi:hypothetical protein